MASAREFKYRYTDMMKEYLEALLRKDDEEKINELAARVRSHPNFEELFLVTKACLSSCLALLKSAGSINEEVLRAIDEALSLIDDECDKRARPSLPRARFTVKKERNSGNSIFEQHGVNLRLFSEMLKRNREAQARAVQNYFVETDDLECHETLETETRMDLR